MNTYIYVPIVFFPVFPGSFWVVVFGCFSYFRTVQIAGFATSAGRKDPGRSDRPVILDILNGFWFPYKVASVTNINLQKAYPKCNIHTGINGVSWFHQWYISGYMLPIGGLYVTYHLVGEPQATIDIMGIFKGNPPNATLHQKIRS